MCDLTFSNVSFTNVFLLHLGIGVQGPPHKTRHTETIRKGTWEGPEGHGHRGKVPEQNANSLCSKIKN